MKASDCGITAVVPKDRSGIALTITSGGSAARSITFLGGTISTAEKLHASGHTLMFLPDKPGIIGVSIGFVSGASKEFIIPVKKNEGTGNQPFVFEINELYFPPDGIAYAFDDWSLRVRVGEKVFSSVAREGVDYVIPNQSLYELLAGDITPDQAIEVATEQQKQESESRANRALEEIQRIKESRSFSISHPISSAFDAVKELHGRCED